MTVTTRTIGQLVEDLRAYASGGYAEEILDGFAAGYPEHINERLARAERPAWDATGGVWPNDVDGDRAEQFALHYGIPTETWWIPEEAHRFVRRLANERARRLFIDGDRSAAVVGRLLVVLGRSGQKQLAADAGLTWQELKAIFAQARGLPTEGGD